MGKPLEFASLFAVGLVGSSLLTMLPTLYRPLIGSVVIAFVLTALTVAGVLLWAWVHEKRLVFMWAVALSVAVVLGLGGAVLWLLT